ncbi:MAG: sulfatase-like hydrolase/transferase [Pirellulaceae bacterium]
MVTTDRPNILIVLADGMQAGAVEAASPCLTPTIDELASVGLRFRNAHTTSPTCSPARASFMTGVLPHNHGVLEIEHGRDSDQCVLRTEYPHFAQQLSAAGYRTGYFGKWHIERSHDVAKFGWQQAIVKNASHLRDLGKGDSGPSQVVLDDALCGYIDFPRGYRRILHWGVTDTPLEERYPGLTVLDAEQFLIDRLAGVDPWCCCVSFSEPNEALVAGREAWNCYDRASLSLPVNYLDDLSDRPNIYQRQQEIGRRISEEHWRSALACYYARITEVDQLTGRLIEEIDRADALQNTLVVFLADHGRYVGSHGFDAHNVGGFEEIYRIPLIVSGPGIARGRDCRAYVSIADLGSTLCEIGTGTPFQHADSTSFRKLLSDPDQDSTDFSIGYSEYHGTRFALTQRILWKDGWKLVFNGFDFDELYHLDDDPFEMRNRIAEDDQQPRIEDMMAEIWRRARDTGDRTILESHYFSMRFACVGPDVDDPLPT